MEQIVKANGIDIWCEDFGKPDDPAILLIMGIGTPGVSWPDELCHGLADAGYRVIRFDNRDVGLSSTIDYEKNPYTLTDMAEDAAGVLDALGIDAAHIVGASLGGMVAQELAIAHPEKVLSLITAISTPATIDSTTGQPTHGLPSMKMELLTTMMEIAAAPVTTREERIEASLKLYRALGGGELPMDEALIRAAKARELDRLPEGSEALHLAITLGESSANQSLAVGASRDRVDLLKDVSVPTLVIHGAQDPIFPVEHGEATAKAIPGAELRIVEGMGHSLPHDLDELILGHIRKASS
jgi:pimeloyl-ACP methyl ester carboxylesterase